MGILFFKNIRWRGLKFHVESGINIPLSKEKMQKRNPAKPIRPLQHQPRPGFEKRMSPDPIFDYPDKKGSDTLKNKIALITGGDSGIGRAVAVLFAKEGAGIAIAYLNEHKDAKATRDIIEKRYNRNCLLIPGNLSHEKHCQPVIKKTISRFKRINILINNAAVRYEHKKPEQLTTRQLLRTFETNIFSFFWITKAALPYIKKGGCIINSSSVTAYRGSAALIDYAATKGLLSLSPEVFLPIL